MDTTLKIYGIPLSRASRCLWLARELGIPHENIPVHFNETRESPALMAINPNARVPAIDDGGFHLYESMAINFYLAKKYGAGSPIVPSALEGDALVLQWSFWVMTEIEKPLLALMLHSVGRRLLDDATTNQYHNDLVRPLGVLDAHLSAKGWLVGGEFTIADLNVASVMVYARAGQFDLTPYPQVADWLSRCMARPAFKAR
jgi:glutathione S-transferase